MALQLARESVVLLKNSGLLPLDRTKVRRIAVFGANATDQAMLYGNYNGIPTHATTILDGIRAQAGPGGPERGLGRGPERRPRPSAPRRVQGQYL